MMTHPKCFTQPAYADWHDIEGYSHLVSSKLKEKE